MALVNRMDLTVAAKMSVEMAGIPDGESHQSLASVKIVLPKGLAWLVQRGRMSS